MSQDVPWKVVIAGDHPLVLRGLADLICCQPSLSIVDVANDGEAALSAIRQHQPRLAVLEVYMPKSSGLDILAAINRERLAARVVLLTTSFDSDHLLDAIALGARGIIRKGATPQSLVDCLMQVARGRRWLSPEFIRSRIESVAPASDASNLLTAREAEMVRLLTEGFPNNSIARRLSLTEGTLKTHLHNLYAITGVEDRKALVSLILGRQGRHR